VFVCPLPVKSPAGQANGHAVKPGPGPAATVPHSPSSSSKYLVHHCLVRERVSNGDAFGVVSRNWTKGFLKR